MIEKIKKEKISRSLLYFLADKGKLSEPLLRDGFEGGGVYPGEASAKDFVDKMLLAIGAVFFVFGTIFFFAYNWADMHKFVKIGIVVAAIAATGALALTREDGSFAQKIALCTLVGLTGALFAVVGQIYQSGANAYDFFLAWSIAVALWVWMSRFPPLWMVHIVLLNATLILYVTQVHRVLDEKFLAFLLIALNLPFLAGWEYFRLAGKPLFAARWFPRILYLACGGWVLSVVTQSIFGGWGGESGNTNFYLMGWSFYLLLGASIYWVYYRKIKDMFFLASYALSVIFLGAMLLVRAIEFGQGGNELSLLFSTSIYCVGATWFTVVQLKKINTAWKTEELQRD